MVWALEITGLGLVALVVALIAAAAIYIFWPEKAYPEDDTWDVWDDY
jgi:hypothetical protein